MGPGRHKTKKCAQAAKMLLWAPASSIFDEMARYHTASRVCGHQAEACQAEHGGSENRPECTNKPTFGSAKPRSDRKSYP